MAFYPLAHSAGASLRCIKNVTSLLLYPHASTNLRLIVFFKNHARFSLVPVQCDSIHFTHLSLSLFFSFRFFDAFSSPRSVPCARQALSLFSALAQRPAFAPFKWRDAVIWSSGTFPRFASVELGWWAWLLPWSLVVRVGNYRSGVPFERKTLDHFPDEV